MKKGIIVLNVLSFLLLLAGIATFICGMVELANDVEIGIGWLSVWIHIFAIAIPSYVLTLLPIKKRHMEYKAFSNESIKVWAKRGIVLINTDKEILKYKKIKIGFQEIVECQMVNNQTIIEKSGVGESIVGGLLFGGTGAIAGAMVGKKQTTKDNYKIFIKTNNIMHAGLVIALKVENAYNLFETLKIIINNENKKALN